MKEPKFRAWDWDRATLKNGKADKKIMYHEVVVGGFDTTLPSYFWDTDYPPTKTAATIEEKSKRKRDALGNGWINLTEEAVLMQYTGLKDKNGRDIYEGDIVRVTNKGYDKLHEIKWMRVGFAMIGGFTAHLDNPGTMVEIIGNIYENPELLEAQE